MAIISALDPSLKRRTLMKKVVAAGFAVCACVALANDWYVDPTVPDDSHDGTSSNVVSATVGPKRTLAGVMAAGVGVGDGDTVWLLPGEHKEGTMNGGLNRLYVTQKNLKVKSLSGNPFDTSIVGEYDVGVTNNFTGADSVSCVKFAKAAKDCIVEGVMLRDATARYLGDTKEYGGGIYDQSMSCWAINCVFSNCSARAGGGLYGGSAVRCRFIHCAAGNTSTGSAIHTAKQAAFCLFQDCDWNSSGARGV